MRSRSLYDRLGIIGEGGDIEFYLERKRVDGEGKKGEVVTAEKVVEDGPKVVVGHEQDELD